MFTQRHIMPMSTFFAEKKLFFQLDLSRSYVNSMDQHLVCTQEEELLVFLPAWSLLLLHSLELTDVC